MKKETLKELVISIRHNAAFKFVLKGVGAYVLWYILYNLIILPASSLDLWIEHSEVISSGWLLGTLGYKVFTQANVIGIHNFAGIEVTSGCDGLAAIGLFISFLVAFPGDMRRRLFMILSGCVLLVIANILRICMLALCQRYWPGTFAFFHLYLTEAVYDGFVVVLWIFWVNWGQAKRRSEETVNPSGALG